MPTEEKLIRKKLSLIVLSDLLKNISQACASMVVLDNTSVTLRKRIKSMA
jgi:hypothetical protein